VSIDDVLYEVLGPLAQGAPGNEASTLHALDAIPDRDGIRRVLDLGAGHGRTTLSLARALPGAQVVAVDVHAPFVEGIAEEAREAGLAGRVRGLCGDMERIDVDVGSIDLIWAEGSIYVVGVERALATWHLWLRPGGWVAFSDIAWWTGSPSGQASAFWASEYPDMVPEATTCARAEAAGYRVLKRFHLTAEAHDAYYGPLEARIGELARCVDADVKHVLRSLRREIDIVRRFSDEAGYTFFILQRRDA
jgi:SAM-dependent methyltransferase